MHLNLVDVAMRCSANAALAEHELRHTSVKCTARQVSGQPLEVRRVAPVIVFEPDKLKSGLAGNAYIASSDYLQRLIFRALARIGINSLRTRMTS